VVEKDEEEITSQEKDELEEAKIRSAIKRIKLKKAAGIDGISIRLKNLRENC